MRLLITLSLAIGLGGFSYPFFLGSLFFDTRMDPAIYVSLFLAVCWLAVFTAGLLKFKSRGFWLLIGLPFAAYWPFALFVFSSPARPT